MGKICSLGYGFMKNVVCGEFADPDRKEMIMEGKQDNLLLFAEEGIFVVEKDFRELRMMMMWNGVCFGWAIHE